VIEAEMTKIPSFVTLNVALTLAVTAGPVLAGSGNVAAAWTVFVLTIPFMVFVLPYFVGVALIRHGSRGERVARKHVVVEEVPVSR